MWQDFIVSRLCLRYKLVKGKYEKEHHRLDVQEMSRYVQLCLSARDLSSYAQGMRCLEQFKISELPLHIV